MPALAFPQSEVADSDAVADALDAGILHWAKGETAEALRCLRQAREAADAAGDDRRALALARAAADLTPEARVGNPSVPAGNDVSSAEPRRSKLPEPPAPSKKYVATPSDEGSEVASSATRSQPVRTSVAPVGKSHQPHAPSASVRPAVTGATLSSRPAAPSARPSTAQNAAATPLPTTSGQQALRVNATSSSHPGPSQTKRPEADADKTREVHQVQRSNGSSVQGSSGKPSTDHSTSNATGLRPVVPAGGADHRLASIRVHVDGVDPDGSVRVRVLDLAATASGEDNAILVMSQTLWQELKRGGRD